MTDTHTHLYMAESYPGANGMPGEGCRAAVERAISAGIGMMVLPNVDVDSVDPMLSLHRAFPENTVVSIGLHPTEVRASWRDDLREIRYRMADTPYTNWGEIGIDLYWEQDFRTHQMDAFGHQLDEAYSEGKPVVIHSRAAWDETLEVLRMMGDRCPRVHFHSFTSGPQEARRVLEQIPDATFGINGVATFKNGAEVRNALHEMGIERILLETDSPYLAPVPVRGRTNESSYLPYICGEVARELNLSPAEVEAITDRNARFLTQKA